MTAALGAARQDVHWNWLVGAWLCGLVMVSLLYGLGESGVISAEWVEAMLAAVILGLPYVLFNFTLLELWPLVRDSARWLWAVVVGTGVLTGLAWWHSAGAEGLSFRSALSASFALLGLPYVALLVATWLGRRWRWRRGPGQ